MQSGETSSNGKRKVDALDEVEDVRFGKKTKVDAQAD